MRNKNEELLPVYNMLSQRVLYDKDTGYITWSCNKRGKKGKLAGCKRKDGYVHISTRFEGVAYSISSHRLAWFIYNGSLPKNQIDHINGKKNDNRILNLRECTQQQNLMNRASLSSNKSGFKGVSWDNRAKKWRAQIAKDDIDYYLGLFECPRDASLAYESKGRELHGEFFNQQKKGIER